MRSVVRLSLAGVALAAVVLGRPTVAKACKCRFVNQRELAESDTVFVGTAVEFLMRSDSGGEPGQPGPRVNAATRFQVQYSRDLPVGSSFTVAMDLFTSCSTSFAVGERHLVVARMLGDLPFATECPLVSDQVERAVLTALGAPADFLAPRSRQDHSPAPGCNHPDTLDEAFDTADVVGWWDPAASCLVPSTETVEHAAVMRWAWKGLQQGESIRLRIEPPGDEPAPPPFRLELLDATNMHWPPAAFLRREHDYFVDDGCLRPLAPASLDEGKEAVLRLFALPHDYRGRVFYGAPRPLPPLSCMTLDDGYFAHADAAVAAYVHSRGAERTSDARRAAAPVPPGRDGSCGACAASREASRSRYIGFASSLAFAFLLRKRRH